MGLDNFKKELLEEFGEHGSPNFYINTSWAAATQEAIETRKPLIHKQLLSLKEKNIEITELNLKIRELDNKYSLFGFESYAKLFVDYLTSKGDSRSVLGYFRKETRNHIQIMVYDVRLDVFYKYMVNKERIQGTKIYSKTLERDDEILKKLKSKNE